MNGRIGIGTAAVALLVGGLLTACGGGDEGVVERDEAVAGAVMPGSEERGPESTDGPGPAGEAADTIGPAAAPGSTAPARGAGDAVEGSGSEASPASGTGTAGSAGEQPGSAAGPETPVPAMEEEAAGSPDPDAGGQASTAEILRATSRAYEGLRSFQAEFDQELRNTLLGRTTRSAGMLYQRRPDRFLMDFSDPEGDRIVSDGRYFWMYFPSVDAKQVIRTSRGGQGLDLHAQFIGDPVARFEATHHGRESVRGRPADVVTLVPREPLGYRRLKVWIDVEDHLVRRFELTEQNENVRRLELGELRINPSLPDDLFEFSPPADAIVVDRG